MTLFIVHNDAELIALIQHQIVRFIEDHVDEVFENEVTIDLAIGSPSPLLRDHILDGLLESKAREQLGLLLSARRTK